MRAGPAYASEAVAVRSTGFRLCPKTGRIQLELPAVMLSTFNRSIQNHLISAGACEVFCSSGRRVKAAEEDGRVFWIVVSAPLVFVVVVSGLVVFALARAFVAVAESAVDAAAPFAVFWPDLPVAQLSRVLVAAVVVVFGVPVPVWLGAAPVPADAVYPTRDSRIAESRVGEQAAVHWDGPVVWPGGDRFEKVEEPCLKSRVVPTGAPLGVQADDLVAPCSRAVDLVVHSDYLGAPSGPWVDSGAAQGLRSGADLVLCWDCP
jgi:hypothetical protein